MGTNFYVKTGRKLKVTCNYGFEHEIDEELHIGKNSFGWLFTLHIIPEIGINELRDWIPILFKGKIRNEYGDEIKYNEMIKIILKDEKSDLVKKSSKEIENILREMNKGVLFSNYITVMDENSGLLRVKCNKEGEEGNYCLFDGEFS